MYAVEERDLTLRRSHHEEKITFTDHEGGFAKNGLDGSAGLPDVMNAQRETHTHHHLREAAKLVAQEWQGGSYKHLVLVFPERFKNIVHEAVKHVLPGERIREVYGNHTHAEKETLRDLFDKAFLPPEK